MPASLGPTLADDDEKAARVVADNDTAFLFVVLESERLLAGGSRHQLDGVRSVVIGRASERRAVRSETELELRIPDGRLSHQHARLTRVRGRWVLEDAGSRNGTRVNGEHVEQVTLSDGAVIEAGRTLLLFRERLPRCAELDLDAARGSVLTLSPTLEREFAKLQRVAGARGIAILIEGESGSGKEVLARKIMEWSGRTGAFVAVNCGALVDNLVESQLFGSTRGAFSGATQDRLGFVRSADQGCLFLDEVAELPLTSQATLLRVLEEHEVVPVGATRSVPVDVKVLAATHQDLDARVKNGRFRRDLFARLGAFRVSLPPLRERVEDLGLLVQALLAKAEPPRDVRFTSEAARALIAYEWPLNVRELSHALGAASLLAPDRVIDLQHLPEPVRVREGSVRPPALNEEQAMQRQELIELLEKHHGNVSSISRELGKARMQIQRWLRRYDLDAESFRE